VHTLVAGIPFSRHVSHVPVTGTAGVGALYPALAAGSSGLTKPSCGLIDHIPFDRQAAYPSPVRPGRTIRTRASIQAAATTLIQDEPWDVMAVYRDRCA
jgi:hypothetical protein